VEAFLCIIKYHDWKECVKGSPGPVGPQLELVTIFFHVEMFQQKFA